MILRERPEGFRRWSEQQVVFDEMGLSGVFTAEGEQWKSQRRLVITALNTNHLHRYYEVIRTSAERLHRRLGDAAHVDRVLEISHELTSYSLDITSALAFGYDLKTLEGGENELQEHIQRAFGMLVRRIAAPFPYWRWIGCRLTAPDRSLEELHRAVAGFVEQARARIAERPELREAPENVLESMISAQKNDCSFTDEEIIGNTRSCRSRRGHDRATLGYALAAPNPPRRPQAARRRGAGDPGRGCLPGRLQTVARLSYGEAVLRESLRVKGVTPLITAEPLADTTICEAHIPAGTELLMLLRYPNVSEHPADGFDPDRWLHSDEESAPKFLTFGAGPRFCPGRNLAFLEAKTALAMIARNFQIELDSSAGEVSEYYNFVTIPKGLRVRVPERTPP